MPMTAALVTAVLAAAAPARAESATRARFVMGTVCEITAHGPAASAALTAAFDDITRLDRVMSNYKDDSELSHLVRMGGLHPVAVSLDLYKVLREAAEVHRLSGGAFDVTILRGKRAPGMSLITLTPNGLTVALARPNLAIDLGGIGKGYALDSAAAVLKKMGVASALLNFGGEILALGRPPGLDAWETAVAGSDVKLLLRDGAVSTSSQEEKPGHILDPKTGKPVARAGRVTVAAGDATTADAWSTALFVLGVSRAPKEFPGCAIETSAAGKVVAKAGDCAKYLAKPPPKGPAP